MADVAKSSYAIQMEFGKAEEQANRLEQIGKDLGRTANDTLGGTLSNIGSSWNSNSSSDYLKKGRKVQEELQKRAQELRDTASAIRKIAKDTYEAEMRAYYLAKTRKY